MIQVSAEKIYRGLGLNIVGAMVRGSIWSRKWVFTSAAGFKSAAVVKSLLMGFE